MTTLYEVRPYRPTLDGPLVAVVTEPEAAEAVANLMGVVCIVTPVPAVKPKPPRCFLCDPVPFDFFRLPFFGPICLPPKFSLVGPLNVVGI